MKLSPHGVVADGNIGDFRVDLDYGPAMVDEYGVLYDQRAGIFANADRVGDLGVIERIYTGGDFGQAFGVVGDLPVSAGSRGGNVRFVDITGQIHQSLTGWWDVDGFGPFTFPDGQGVVITDDSGAQIRITPGYQGRDTSDDWILGPNFVPPEGSDIAGVLSLQLLPIRDVTPDSYQGTINWTILGYAVAGITSTDGLRVQATGGPVELGHAVVTGVNDNAVVISGFPSCFHVTA